MPPVPPADQTVAAAGRTATPRGRKPRVDKNKKKANSTSPVRQSSPSPATVAITEQLPPADDEADADLDATNIASLVQLSAALQQQQQQGDGLVQDLMATESAMVEPTPGPSGGNHVAWMASQNDEDWSFDDYKDRCAAEANRLIEDVFPRIVDDISKLLQLPNYRLDHVTAINQLEKLASQDDDDNGTSRPAKHQRMDMATEEEDERQEGEDEECRGPLILEQKDVVQLLTRLKPMLSDLWERANVIKQWLRLTLPKDSACDLFGATVQQQTLKEAELTQDFAKESLSDICYYHAERAADIDNMLKCGKGEAGNELERAVIEVDKTQFIRAHQTLVDLRTHYLILHDCVAKNMNKFGKLNPTSYYHQ